MQEAASRAPAVEKETPDYRLAVELNRMEADLTRLWKQRAASDPSSVRTSTDYSTMPGSLLA